MSFYASNNRIWITDTDGTLVFDTNNDMPSIIGVYETTLSKSFHENYYTEEYQTIATLPDRCDFVICRASCTPTNMVTGAVGQNAYEKLNVNGTQYTIPWANNVPSGETFFQGSMILETGTTAVSQSVAQYARRVLHVYPKPTWGNKLIAMFQQGVKSGFGNVPSSNGHYIQPDGTAVYPNAVALWPPKPGKAFALSQTNGAPSGYGYAYSPTDQPDTPKSDKRPAPLVPIAPNATYVVDEWGPAGVKWDINLKVWVGRFR